MNVKVLCGFSGTLKSAIAGYLSPSDNVLSSPTKFVRDFDRTVGGECLDTTPMTNLMVRMACLQYVNKEDLVIERSFYDYIFYSILMKVPMFDKLTDFNFRMLNTMEYEAVGERDYYVIINEAYDFIQNKVLGSHYTRNDIYTTLDEYDKLQKRYLDFIGMFIGEHKTLRLTDELAERICNGEEFDLPWE